MRGDSVGALGRATWEETADLCRQSGLKVLIDPDAAGVVALSAALPRVGVGHALLLCIRERRLLDQDALPFMPLPAAAPPHHDCRQAARLRGTTGERGVPRREEHKMIQVGAAEAERASVLHPKQIASPTALATGPIPDRLDDQHAGRSVGLWHKASPPAKAG
jgi:hypothetical protein